jgi:hypothetical protein
LAKVVDVVGDAELRGAHVEQARDHVAAAVRQAGIRRRRDAERAEIRRTDGAVVDDV